MQLRKNERNVLTNLTTKVQDFRKQYNDTKITPNSQWCIGVMEAIFLLIHALWKSNFFSSKLAYMHRLQVESLFQWSDVFSSVCQGSNAFSVLHKKMVTLIAGAASIVYSKVDMNLIKNGQK